MSVVSVMEGCLGIEGGGEGRSGSGAGETSNWATPTDRQTD